MDAGSWLPAARAGVSAADVRGRAVAGAPGAEGEHDEDAREPVAAARRIRRGLRVLSGTKLCLPCEYTSIL